jgi:basic membrane protein A and related proteins
LRLSIILGAFAAIFVTGCNGGTTTSTDSSEGPLRVGVVFDAGGRGDKSFNDSAWAGIEKAKADFGIEAKTVETKSIKDFETNQAALADQGLDLVVAVGFTQQRALEQVAKRYPNVKFAIVDAVVEQENVRNLLFKEEQGSFLAGYLAGLMSQTGRIGFVGGMTSDLIKKFEVGYIAGARTANPNIVVLPPKYTESWDDVTTGKAAAKVLFDGGADVVYHAAGRAGMGVIDAARESRRFAIGVDSDQDDEAPGHVLTSMIKRVDVAVYETIKDIKEGQFSPGSKQFDLAVDGVGLSEMRHTRDKVGAENLRKLEEVKQKIVAGEIQVPSTQAELNAYQPA